MPFVLIVPPSNPMFDWALRKGFLPSVTKPFVDVLGVGSGMLIVLDMKDTTDTSLSAAGLFPEFSNCWLLPSSVNKVAGELLSCRLNLLGKFSASISSNSNELPAFVESLSVPSRRISPFSLSDVLVIWLLFSVPSRTKLFVIDSTLSNIIVSFAFDEELSVPFKVSIPNSPAPVPWVIKIEPSVNTGISSTRYEPACDEELSVPFRIIESVLRTISSASSSIICSSRAPIVISTTPNLRCTVSENKVSNVEASIGENFSSGAGTPSPV